MNAIFDKNQIASDFSVIQKNRKNAKRTYNHTFPKAYNLVHILLSHYKTIEQNSKAIPQKSFIPKQPYSNNI